MNWKELVANLVLPETTWKTTYRFHRPTSENTLLKLKKRFGLRELPPDLESLYRQTDGITELMDGKVVWTLIWPVRQLIEWNQEQRRAYEDVEEIASFDDILFFADAGNGDLFGYAITDGGFLSGEVIVWDHEEDTRRPIAVSLADYLEGWPTGRITI